MMKKLNLIIVLALFTIFATGQEMFEKYTGKAVGIPESDGSYNFDEKIQKFKLEAMGESGIYFVSQQIDGDFILTANLASVDNETNDGLKYGLMIRDANDEDAVFMSGTILENGRSVLEYREESGGGIIQQMTDISTLPGLIQVERKDNEFLFRVAQNGEPLSEAVSVTLEMGEEVLAGMYTVSGSDDATTEAEFWNVRMVKPADESVSGYQNPSPSRLEILDIETGVRTVIYETEDHIEAPNWSRDGEFLVYNSGGRLYRFDLETGEPEVIDTDDVVNSNNDHGISFDGELIALSSSTPVDGANRSIIYTVPIDGGVPKRITENGPSYWHGWSPDGLWLVYCASREGNYDVYKIPSDGGQEIRLTDAEGLDDGPEYSPDGEYIYFNSVRSGTMQIWRMKPDGSDQEQVTFDEFNDWFAHPSPDGEQMIMVSFPVEVPAGSHPRNQRVMLRTKPINGGNLKAVAYVYGGQGTINVPSWSPDSKKVAFVSYTY